MVCHWLLPDAGKNWIDSGLAATAEQILAPRKTPGQLSVTAGDSAPRTVRVVHALWNMTLHAGEQIRGELVNYDVCVRPYVTNPVALIVSSCGSFAELSEILDEAPGTVLVIVVSDSWLEFLSCELSGLQDARSIVPTVLLSSTDGAQLYELLAQGKTVLLDIVCPGDSADPPVPLGPQAVASDEAGDVVYIADMPFHCVWVWHRKTSTAPSILAGIRGVEGDGDCCDGLACEVALESPHDLALSPDGHTLFICELYSVCAVDLRAEPPTLTRVFESEYDIGGIALHPDGTRLVVADRSRHRLLAVPLTASEGFAMPDVIAGTSRPGPLRSGDPALATCLNQPSKVTVTPKGDIIFFDAGNKALRVIEHCSGLVHTLSGAIDTPDGLALGPQGSVLVSEGRHHVVVKFQPRPGQFTGAVSGEGSGTEWDWSRCVGTGQAGGGWFEKNAAALEICLRRPQGLAWAPKCGLFVCDPVTNALWLVHALTPWVWRGPVVVLRRLVETGRANLQPSASDCAQHEGMSTSLYDALSILIRLPDEEFREVLSWWGIDTGTKATGTRVCDLHRGTDVGWWPS